MSIIKGKELMDKIETKERVGYLSINLNPDQWKLVRSGHQKVDDFKDNQEKVYLDKNNNNRLDLRLSIDDESVTIAVIGEENISEIVELFNELNTVYAKVTYEQIYMKGRTLKGLEILDYDKGIKSDSEDMFN